MRKRKYDERPAAEASRKPAPKPEVLKEEAASFAADDYDDETGNGILMNSPSTPANMPPRSTAA